MAMGHDPAMRRTLPLVLVALALLAPSLSMAKAPSKKEVDEVLLRLSVEQLTELRAAEDGARAGKTMLEQIEAELSVAMLDLRASKAWVDAGQAILKAIEADERAAGEGHRVDELARLASQRVRSEASLAWREARQGAAKAEVAYHQSRVVWGRAELARLEQAVELERLEAYDVGIGGDPDTQQEIGRAQTKLGRLAGTESKERGKMERAEADWQEAVARAAALDPVRTDGP